jgi:hypothetical protein
LVHLKEIKQLRWLELSMSPLGEAGFRHLGQLAELQELRIANDVQECISGGLFAHLANNPRLERVYLDSSLSDEDLHRLEHDLPNVNILSLRDSDPPVYSRVFRRMRSATDGLADSPADSRVEASPGRCNIS